VKIGEIGVNRFRRRIDDDRTRDPKLIRPQGYVRHDGAHGGEHQQQKHRHLRSLSTPETPGDALGQTTAPDGGRKDLR
jgi:hypothetical protein